MIKLIRIVGISLLVGFIVVSLTLQLGLYYAEKIELGEEPNTPICTAVYDSAYISHIENSRRIVKSMMKYCKIPGLSISVARKGKMIWSEGFGYSNIEERTEVCPNTIFRIGSISKSLTAAGLMRVCEKSKLSLNDDIRLILSEFPDKGYPITPLQLASHQAGIRPYFDDSEAISTKHYSSAIESIERFKNDSLIFIPGNGFEYSNYGYVLLSAVMEKAYRDTFLNIMDDEVFVPLNMKSTVPELYDTLNQNISSFYDNETPYSVNGQIQKSPFIDYSCKWASGGFMSTTEDLIKFADIFSQIDSIEFFLTKQSIDKMLHPYTSQLGIINYGLGFMMARDAYLRSSFFHFGAGSGATSLLTIFPTHNTTIVILANLGHAKFPFSHLMGIINEFVPRPARILFYLIDALCLLFVISFVWKMLKKI